MKFANLFVSLVLFSGGLVLAEDHQTVDPSTILYSTPTIPNELPPMVEFVSGGDLDVFPIHEDEWSQIEFFAPSQLQEIQKLMEAYKIFEVENRREYGWSSVFVRDFNHKSLFSASHPRQKLLGVLGSDEGPPPQIYSFSGTAGLVRNGFSIPIGRGVSLYGYFEGEELMALGAFVGENPDSEACAAAFSKINKEFGLLLVDWRAQFILTGFDNSGQIQVWEP